MKLLTITLLFITTNVVAQSQSKAIADKIVAVVGDSPILQSEIKNALDDSRRSDMNSLDTTECQLLRRAVVAKVLMLQAEKDSLQAPAEEIEAELDQRIRYFINLLGSEAALEDYAHKPVYQIKADSRQIVKERRLAELMQQKILGNVKITPAEVKTFFDNIPKDSLPFLESELEIGTITIYPKPGRDLELYTIAELNNFKKQIETKVASFEQLAIENSIHVASKEHGGRFQINRNENTWGPEFISAAFRLKEGEISNPVKSKDMGYFLIQMIERRGDDADVRLILRAPAVTNREYIMAAARLDTARAMILAGTMGFNEAALKYSEDEITKFQGPFILNMNGSPYVSIDQLGKAMIETISTLKVGGISQPVGFTDESGKKGVRLLYLKSRSEPHRMNLKDDYSRISFMALDKKRSEVLNRWLKRKIPSFYITISNEAVNGCPLIKEYTNQKFASN